MATNELKTFTTGIADAIREAEGGGGGTTKINPQDFADRIRNLRGGNLVSEDVDLIWEDGDSFILDSAGMYILKFATPLNDITITVVTDGGGTNYTLKSDTHYALIIAVDKVNERTYYVCQSTDVNTSSGFYCEEPSWATWKLYLTTANSSNYLVVTGYYIHP